MNADQSKYARRLDEEIRSTIIWLGVSVLSVITGVEQIYQHHNSGWLLAATPLLSIGWLFRAQSLYSPRAQERTAKLDYFLAAMSPAECDPATQVSCKNILDTTYLCP